MTGLVIETQADVDSMLGSDDQEESPLRTCLGCGALHLTITFIPGYMAMCHGCGGSLREIAESEAGTLFTYLRRHESLPELEDQYA